MEKEQSQESETRHSSLGDVGGSFVVRRGVPRFPYYWKDGEWIKDKNIATKYTYDQAERLSKELGCAFTDAE